MAPRFMIGGEKGGANFLMSLPESVKGAAVTALLHHGMGHY